MSDWFRAFMDAAPEVYFRYALVPSRRFAYISRAVESLTGHPAAAFHSDAAFCVLLIVREDRRVLRQILRARRGLTSTVRLLRRDGDRPGIAADGAGRPRSGPDAFRLPAAALAVMTDGRRSRNLLTPFGSAASSFASADCRSVSTAVPATPFTSARL